MFYFESVDYLYYRSYSGKPARRCHIQDYHEYTHYTLVKVERDFMTAPTTHMGTMMLIVEYDLGLLDVLGNAHEPKYENVLSSSLGTPTACRGSSMRRALTPSLCDPAQWPPRVAGASGRFGQRYYGWHSGDVNRTEPVERRQCADDPWGSVWVCTVRSMLIGGSAVM